MIKIQRNLCNPINQRYRITTDVLVIGGGAAGIRAALAASEEGVRVILVTKAPLAESGSTFSPVSRGWGIQALVGKDRTGENLEAFYDDIMRVGLGQCNPKLVCILVEESGPRLEDLISYGVRFRKDSLGNHFMAKGCFSNYERAFLTEDFQNIKESFLSTIRLSSIKRLTGSALDLVKYDHACWGARVILPGNEMLRIEAKATVLATGGAAGIFRHHLVTHDEIGDGYALAHRAGAEFANLEFIQFMLGINSPNSRRFLPIGDLGTPNLLQDSAGQDLLETHIPDLLERSICIEKRKQHYPFSCRDISCRIDLAVAREKKEGKKVFWADNDSGEELLEVLHYAHAFNGGVKINERAETTVPGLFAAGEVAAGPHGADRIGGCMMTATQVFGERAGRFAAERAKKARFVPEINGTVSAFKKLKNEKAELCAELENAAKAAFDDNLTILRDEVGLRNCLQIIKDLRTELGQTGCKKRDDMTSMRLMTILDVGELIAESARKRPTSIGGHFRSDAGSVPD